MLFMKFFLNVSVSIRALRIPQRLSERLSFYVSKYNFKSNTWTDVHCYGSKPVAAMGACIVAMDRYLYVIDGLMPTEYQTQLKTISPPFRLDTMTLHSGMRDSGNQSWDRITEMKVPRWRACGTAAHGKIFIAGGSLASFVHHTLTCEVYNVDADEWQLIASLNSPRVSGRMVYLKGSLYVMGGQTYYGRGMTVESYDFEEKKWKKKTKSPTSKTFPEWKYDGCALKIPRILVKPIPKRLPALLWPLLLRS